MTYYNLKNARLNLVTRLRTLNDLNHEDVKVTEDYDFEIPEINQYGMFKSKYFFQQKQMKKGTNRFQSYWLEYCVTEIEVVWWREVGGALTYPQRRICAIGIMQPWGTRFGEAHIPMVPCIK